MPEESNLPIFLDYFNRNEKIKLDIIVKLGPDINILGGYERTINNITSGSIVEININKINNESYIINYIENIIENENYSEGRYNYSFNARYDVETNELFIEADYSIPFENTKSSLESLQYYLSYKKYVLFERIPTIVIFSI
ncbi:MAG: hypothetical protein ACYCST_21165 [Acidimicrobiales bacterium]